MGILSNSLQWLRAKDFSELDSVESTDLNEAQIIGKPVVRNIYLRKYSATFALLTEPTPLQTRALDLLGV